MVVGPRALPRRVARGAVPREHRHARHDLAEEGKVLAYHQLVHLAPRGGAERALDRAPREAHQRGRVDHGRVRARRPRVAERSGVHLRVEEVHLGLHAVRRGHAGGGRLDRRAQLGVRALDRHEAVRVVRVNG